MSLSSCSVIPDILSKTELSVCDTQLTDDYVLIKRLGQSDPTKEQFEGVNGVVLQLSDKSHTKVVKIVNLSPGSLTELRVICALEKLQDSTPIFIHVFGYLQCKDIPEEWMDYIGDFPQNFELNNRYLYIFMDYANFRFIDNQIKLNIREFKELLYILLHGLEEAYDQIGFTHGDIHEEQILLIPRSKSKPIAVGEKKMYCRFLPKLIDYGYSLTTFDKKERENDTETLWYIFRQKLYALKSQGMVSEQDVADFRRAIGQNIYGDYFADILNNMSENVESKCIQCGTLAAYSLQSDPVCGQVCGKIWHKKQIKLF